MQFIVTILVENTCCNCCYMPVILVLAEFPTDGVSGVVLWDVAAINLFADCVQEMEATDEL